MITVKKIPERQNELTLLNKINDELVREIFDFSENPNHSLDKTFKLIQPYLAYWKDLLSNPNSIKDSRYHILMSYLASEFYDPIKAIKKYLRYVKYYSDLDSELRYIFFTTLKYIRPRSIELVKPRFAWFLAFRFLFSLKTEICRVVGSKRNYHIIKVSPQCDFSIREYACDKIVYDEHQDYIVERHLDLNPYEAYLFSLLINDINYYEVQRITKNSTMGSLFKTWRRLCRKLRNISQKTS